uniref:Methyltransferase-like protein 9 n=2 Tax=Rhabditophanes sp. KR3021 TaxID=114890 RepID=A0AC35UBL1_9BILA
MTRATQLTRMLCEKEVFDEEFLAADKNAWYSINKRKMSVQFAEQFYPLQYDSGTHEFLINSLNLSNNVCLQMFYSATISFMSIFTTKTNINGILDRGRMHIFSDDQLQSFLNLEPEWISSDKTVLDLGAGDGMVTKHLETFYKNVYVTEMSPIMQWRLGQKGFTTVDPMKWFEHRIIANKEVNLISVLNLLDRHYNPHLLLEQLHEAALSSGALVMLGIVLPVKQFVEFHPSASTNKADTDIFLKGTTFEEQAESIVKNLLVPFGFELIRFSKVPYICEGDSTRPYYKLTDALMLLKAVPKQSSQTISTTTVSSFNGDIHIEL